jgi:hypothetical protein
VPRISRPTSCVVAEMSCILRVTAPSEHIERLVGQLWTRPLKTWHQGDSLVPGTAVDKNRRTSGFDVLIGNGDDGTLDAQIAHALNCLRANRNVLFSWYRENLVESVVVDFGVTTSPNVVAHFARIPVALIHLCSDVRVSIEVSHYLAA